MEIADYEPLTLLDYPGTLAVTIYTQGCNLHCAYCHNKDLIPQTSGILPWDEVFSFLQSRKGLIDSVVFTGGEPTLQSDLPEKILAVKDAGFLVGLHTNGSLPLYELVAPLCNYILLSHYNQRKINIGMKADHLTLSEVQLIDEEYRNILTIVK